MQSAYRRSYALYCLVAGVLMLAGSMAATSARADVGEPYSLGDEVPAASESQTATACVVPQVRGDSLLPEAKVAKAGAVVFGLSTTYAC